MALELEERYLLESMIKDPNANNKICSSPRVFPPIGPRLPCRKTIAPCSIVSRRLIQPLLPPSSLAQGP